MPGTARCRHSPTTPSSPPPKSCVVIDAARPATHISDVWRDWVLGTIDDIELRSILLDEDALWDALATLPDEHRAVAHACTHTTYSPTKITGSPKNNVIPGVVELIVDVRLAGEETRDDAQEFLRGLLDDLPVELNVDWHAPSSRSSRDTPIWSSLERAVRAAYPDGGLVPSLFTGGTDGRYFRYRGIPTFGFGVLSPHMPPARYWSLFHGHDERIDVDSLRLSTAAWEHVALDYLDG